MGGGCVSPDEASIERQFIGAISVSKRVTPNDNDATLIAPVSSA
jgi:hypothetical protein